MMKFEHGDQITRFIGRMGYTGHRTQTFHEVLISVLTSILANPWYDQQLAKRAEDRHIIMQWIGAWCDESQRAVPANHEPGRRYEFKRTGQAQELLALAYDVYCLVEVDRLDRGVRDRLKTDDQFQGARYELAVASIFIRSGSTSNGLISEKDRGLYLKAIEKDPKDKPFAIFIDANLPHQPEHEHLEKTWIPEIFQMVTDHLTLLAPMPAPFSALFITNYAWHYEGRNIPSAGEHCFIYPKRTAHPWKEQATFDAIGEGMLRYGVVPDYEDTAFSLH